MFWCFQHDEMGQLSKIEGHRVSDMEVERVDHVEKESQKGVGGRLETRYQIRVSWESRFWCCVAHSRWLEHTALNYRVCRELGERSMWPTDAKK